MLGVTTLATALFVQDDGHGGGGDGVKIMSAGRILDTRRRFDDQEVFGNIQPFNPNQSINHAMHQNVHLGKLYEK